MHANKQKNRQVYMNLPIFRYEGKDSKDKDKKLGYADAAILYGYIFEGMTRHVKT